MTEYRVLTLPPNYTAEDQQQRDCLMAMLVSLDREMKERSQPIFDALLKIENKYPPRRVLVVDTD